MGRGFPAPRGYGRGATNRPDMWADSARAAGPGPGQILLLACQTHLPRPAHASTRPTTPSRRSRSAGPTNIGHGLLDGTGRGGTHAVNPEIAQTVRSLFARIQKLHEHEVAMDADLFEEYGLDSLRAVKLLSQL